jgi:hypothetical protein
MMISTPPRRILLELTRPEDTSVEAAQFPCLSGDDGLPPRGGYRFQEA